MKKYLSLLLIILMLLLSSCVNKDKSNDPPAIDPEEPAIVEQEPVEPTEPEEEAAVTTDENGFAWRVEPTLEYKSIFYCPDCDVFSIDQEKKLDAKTGMVINDEIHGGHGGSGSNYLYDEKKKLYGCYTFGEGEESFDMLTGDDFLERDGIKLRAFQKIDSEKVIVTEEDWGPSYAFSKAYINKKYALAYGITFVSDFIFDDISESYSLHNNWRIIDLFALRLNGKWGVLDKEGNAVVPFCFEDILLIDEKTAFAKYNGKYGILDINKTTEGTRMIYTTTTEVNLRKGPGTDSDKITTVPKGETVKVADFLDGEWFKVDYKGQAGYMKAEYLLGAAKIDVIPERDKEAFFEATEYQLFPPKKQSYDAEFAEVYKEFFDAVQNKELAVIDSFIDDQTILSFGGNYFGKTGFYEQWNLHSDPEQSELWAKLAEIMRLGGVYDGNEKSFIAPYTYSEWPAEFDGFECFAIIDKEVKVYMSDKTSSDVIGKLSYNIIKADTGSKLWKSGEYWHKSDQALISIKLPGGEFGYIKKQHIKSPIDYRLCIKRNDTGKWILTFLVSGD